MRSHPLPFVLLLASAAVAQCPYYAAGAISAGLSRFNGGEDARLVYVDCLQSIGVVKAKFGTTNGSTNLNGLPLKIAVLDDPTDDKNPADAVLVAQVTIPGGVTGGNTGQWQVYDLHALLGAVVPATGGMWVAVGVTYPSGTSPGPGSIEFFNNIAPGTQWLATDSGGVGVNYGSMSANSLVDIQTGPGFPPGSWVIQVESGAEYRTFGAGCLGSAGVPTLAGGALLPTIDGFGFMLFDATNLFGLADFMLLGFDQIAPPVDVGVIFGVPNTGCGLVVVPLLITPALPVVAGTSSFGFSIAADPALLAVSVIAQTASFDPAANAAGWTVSNGVRAVQGY